NPVNVTITTFIEFIGDIDEINMEFTTILYFRQYWVDPRLAYSDKSSYSKRLSFNPEMLRFIWVPDTHFPGIKEGSKHDITATNEVIRIFPNGSVLYSMRLKVTSQCSMDLRKFPMDSQKCQLKMEAFSYDETEMTLAWHYLNPVVVAKGIEIPSYSLRDVNWFSDKEDFTTGTYSLLTIQFELDRRLGFHMIQIYLPSYLIVILAWVSFWVDREQTAARIAMGITTVLTMATLIGSARVSLPKVSYIKSLEWFLVMCFLFVFSAILEYSFVSYLVFRQRIKHREDYAREVQVRFYVHLFTRLMIVVEVVVTGGGGGGDEYKVVERSREILGNPTETVALLESEHEAAIQEPGQEAVWIPTKKMETVLTKMGVAPTKIPLQEKKGETRIIDLINKVENAWRIAFPLIFLLLNVVYWVYYLGIA
ncbi:hypothetical protein QZH41_015179, partial [Actinostola sp. cb2023]